MRHVQAGRCPHPPAWNRGRVMWLGARAVRTSLPVAVAVTAALAFLASGSPAVGVVSQGAFRMGADGMWSRGFTGVGQTVAIIDEGFGGLDASIAAGELPAREVMDVRSFDATYGLDGRDELGGPTQHGTRMAEIVHDVAPDAHLVLVNYNTLPEFVSAAQWVASRGIPVVSHSNSLLDGPFDGTGPAARAVDRAAADGVLWVNSAGNFGQRHWGGTAAAEGTAVPFTVPAGGGWLDLHLSWRDPGVAAVLTVESLGADGSWVERFRASTSGPMSVAAGPVRVEAGAWRAMIRQTAGPPSPLDLFSLSIPFDPAGQVALGSVATPADAVGALAVAAVPWTGETTAAYSSRGPTGDGRVKPDLSAPTYVTANPAFPGTAGTSAAAAHAAGAALLVRQQRLAAGLPVGVADLRAALVGASRDLGAPGPDTEFGAGLLRLDTSTPTVRIDTVHRGTVLRVRARDDGTLDRIEVAVPGRGVRTSRRAQLGVAVPSGPASLRTVVVRVRDMAGNVVQREVRVPR